MLPGPVPVLTVVTLTIWLVACVALDKLDDLPLLPPCGLHGLTAGYEVRATLITSNANHKSEFFLALRTGGENGELALLTPQGIPVYRIYCDKSGPDVSLQTRSLAMVSPLLLLTYLELIYLDGESLSVDIRPGWMLQQKPGERLLWQSAEEKEIRIQYEGGPPWFRSIKLEDELNGISLVFNIIEASRVLP